MPDNSVSPTPYMSCVVLCSFFVNIISHHTAPYGTAFIKKIVPHPAAFFVCMAYIISDLVWMPSTPFVPIPGVEDKRLKKTRNKIKISIY